jgi:hypothetical protein
MPSEVPPGAPSGRTTATVLITEGEREFWLLLLLMAVFAAMRKQPEGDREPNQAERARAAARSYLRELGISGIALILSVSAAGGLGSMFLAKAWGSSLWSTLGQAATVSLAACLTFNLGWRIHEDSGLPARLRASLVRSSVRSLTGLAALLAGREGKALLDESDGHLAGWSGHDPLTWQKVKQAAGFVKAGVEYRCLNITEAAWKPAEFMLRSRPLSGLFVAGPTIMVAFEVLTHKGTMTLLTSPGSIFGTWAFLAGAIRAGRAYRDVKPPEPRARQSRP